MKIIKIFQENAPTIELYDDDDTDRLNYTLELKEVLRSTEVKIIETTSGCVILKPSEVKSILVSDKPISNKIIDEPVTEMIIESEESIDDQEEDFIGDKDKNV